MVAPPKITIREKISLISKQLTQNHRISFEKLLAKERFRLEIVVTFLAMLELVKRHLIRAKQEFLFGEIELETNIEWNETEIIDLDFGE